MRAISEHKKKTQSVITDQNRITGSIFVFSVLIGFHIAESSHRTMQPRRIILKPHLLHTVDLKML